MAKFKVLISWGNETYIVVDAPEETDSKKLGELAQEILFERIKNGDVDMDAEVEEIEKLSGIELIKAMIHDKSYPEDVLDELVHDLASAQAADANNGGFGSQVEYIEKHMGKESGAKAIAEILDGVEG
jgi:ribonuclease HII